MNFVINMDLSRPPIGRISVNGRRVDMHYREYRRDPETGEDFVCVVYRLEAENSDQ